MFNAKTAAAPKINAFANAVRKISKLKVTPVFRAASGLRFEITVARTSLYQEVVVVDVDRDSKEMRVTGLFIEGDDVKSVGSNVVKSFPQFARVLSNKFGIELAV